MTSKRAAGDKRAVLPRASDYTKSFLKDWERLSRSGRFNMKQLKEAMVLLIENDAPLGREWLDRALTGDWVNHRECHIGGDFLLVYRVDESGRRSKSYLCGRARTPNSSNSQNVQGPEECLI